MFILNVDSRDPSMFIRVQGTAAGDGSGVLRTMKWLREISHRASRCKGRRVAGRLGYSSKISCFNGSHPEKVTSVFVTQG